MALISEGTQPSDDGQGYLFTLGIYTDDQWLATQGYPYICWRALRMRESAGMRLLMNPSSSDR